MFEIVVHKRFAKKFGEMERGHAEKIANLFEMLKIDAIPWKKYDIKKIEGEADTYRVRIGIYRLIYFVDKGNKIIHVLKIERRKRAYR